MTPQHLYFVQSFLLQSLSSGGRLSRKEIAAILAQHLNEEAEAFQITFSKAFNDHSFPGFISSKGRFGGVSLSSLETAQKKLKELEAALSVKAIKELTPQIEKAVAEAGPLLASKTVRATAPPSTEETTEENDADEITGTIINVLPTFRIVSSDSRNWTIQLKTGDTWSAKWFYSGIDGVLEGAAKHLLNAKARKGLLMDLKSLSQEMKKLQQEILSEIKSLPRETL